LEKRPNLLFLICLSDKHMCTWNTSCSRNLQYSCCKSILCNPAQLMQPSATKGSGMTPRNLSVAHLVKKSPCYKNQQTLSSGLKSEAGYPDLCSW